MLQADFMNELMNLTTVEIRKLGKLVHKQKKFIPALLYKLQTLIFKHLEEIGDEFHYILNCPYFKQYRDIYIKKRYTKRPNIINFLGIMAATNRLNLTNLCKFIRIINERVCPPS
jgi:hypothetical protein